MSSQLWAFVGTKHLSPMHLDYVRWNPETSRIISIPIKNESVPMSSRGTLMSNCLINKLTI